LLNLFLAQLLVAEADMKLCFGRQRPVIRLARDPLIERDGRLEVPFDLFQVDRLVKEMRLRGVSTTAEGNRFLASYLPGYNRRFSVPPKKAEDLHRSCNDLDLDTILCIKTERFLKNDNTIQYHGVLYQIDDTIRAKTVTVEEHLDGSMKIRYKGSSVAFHKIPLRPAKPEKERPFVPKGKGHRPPLDSSWRPPWFRRSRKATDAS